jgi:hypothetical protein
MTIELFKVAVRLTLSPKIARAVWPFIAKKHGEIGHFVSPQYDFSVPLAV